MASKSINATEVARNFSDVLNRVKYQDASFDVVRGGEIVARIVPPSQCRGLSAAEMNQLIAALPRLDPSDSEYFKRDIELAVRQTVDKETPWD